MPSTVRALLAAALLPCGAAGAASDFLPETLLRVQAYDGPARPRSEVAILFTMDGRPNSESATICAIDGISLERDGVCASVVHVLPGPHQLKLRYRSMMQFGTGELWVDAAANRLYQLNFSSLRVDYAAKLSVIPMYAGARLSWRQLAPGLAKGSPRIDEEVPYETNSERGGPVEAKIVSDADRATVDRLLGCAGKFAADIELRKLDHREYESRFAAVGAFTQATLPFVGEEEALSGTRRAQRDAMATHAAAFKPPEAATEDSKRARAELALDLQACADFFAAHRARSRP